ncbi:endolytic transglycosylase MltG [Streptosporangium sp. NPDC000396]|uniref:endolytic transglycosylase MltG n=1 Tax=Streptosporangium sp. NPDC000396 TaxID=3366185 RepID=UPI0036BE6CCA
MNRLRQVCLSADVLAAVEEGCEQATTELDSERRAGGGLPPGPVTNPGQKALAAALCPDQGDWLWFVTTDPEHRITKFTEGESEFVRYREELNTYLGTR